MTGLQRKALYAMFLAGFIASAPAVVLYTAGWRVDWAGGGLVQAGLISASSVPRGADVSVDGKPREARTPAVIDDLIPGEHLLSLGRPGYLPWEKALPVESRLTTFAPDVLLYLDEAPQRPLMIAPLAVSEPARGKFAYTLESGGWRETWVNEPEAGATRMLSRMSSASSAALTLEWSADAAWLAVRTNAAVGERITLIHDGDGKSIAVSDAAPTATAGWWDPNDPDRFFVRGPRGIFAMDLPDPAPKPVSKTAVAAVGSGNDLVLVEQQKDGVSVVSHADDLPFTLGTLPDGEYEFLPAPSGAGLLRDRRTGTLWTFDPADARGNGLIELGTAVAWAWHGRSLLFSDGYDLVLYEADRRTQTVLTRVSAPIRHVAWHPSGSTVLFVRDTTVSALELDDRGGRIETALMEGTGLGLPWIDDRARTMYLYATVGGEPGLYARALQR
ncbi:hypothetical protein A2856_01485 [Candidatus Uhrbacteria bacterium RIFCSPHIGHO2_01_FULL_63_20]|uniref:PEGA domain-containing protein n=1 Tax=Candidatus Uhrbacteria bacterium RIFCSPHIGHO2_01_FULL_63_20 TaxID=1802385 RepID=A0A1F7TK44_9BACT|nr:MAG: hypothetical protein A2856_01485 [Candidatus Uhrbacteria bacterium RIFCSPHIGHO2_01_FULL_63_20]